MTKGWIEVYKKFIEIGAGKHGRFQLLDVALTCFRVAKCFAPDNLEFSLTVNAALSHFTKGHPLLLQVMNATKSVFRPGRGRDLVGPDLVSQVLKNYLGISHERFIKNMRS